MWKVLIALFALSLAAQAQAQTQAHAHASDLREITGLKYPNDPGEGQGPVPTTALALKAGAKAEGFTELLEFALRAPDQEEAGSCLYMSLTGIAEWWLAKLNPRASRGPEGPLDLSERYLMNIAGIEENENGIPNWKTDSIFLFNQHGSTLLNRDYRFAKGWYAYDAEGNIFRANADTPGAVYDAYYSWIDERETVTTATRIRLPRFTREVLFADPASNQWNTGVMPADIVARIKSALVKRKAPVQIMYNHFGYWHVATILGFNDQQDNENCKFVRRFMSHMGTEAAAKRALSEKTEDPSERARLVKSAEKFEWALAHTQAAWRRGGGCHPRGVFYVRDSIYQDPEGPLYDYDLSRTGEESPYAQTIVLHEYDWVRYMANHATQISVVN